MNLIGKVLPFLGDAPLGSTYDLMFARRTGGYTFWFWFGLCSQALIIALSLILKSKLGGGEDEEEKVKALTELANEINQACPKVLDDWTRIYSAVAGPGLRLTYRYTLTLPPGRGRRRGPAGHRREPDRGLGQRSRQPSRGPLRLGHRDRLRLQESGRRRLFSISRKKA
jgi:hypothetical protein